MNNATFKQYRETMGLSATELAEMLAEGNERPVNPRTIRGWESESDKYILPAWAAERMTKLWNSWIEEVSTTANKGIMDTLVRDPRADLDRPRVAKNAAISIALGMQGKAIEVEYSGNPKKFDFGSVGQPEMASLKTYANLGSGSWDLGSIGGYYHEGRSSYKAPESAKQAQLILDEASVQLGERLGIDGLGIYQTGSFPRRVEDGTVVTAIQIEMPRKDLPTFGYFE